MKFIKSILSLILIFTFSIGFSQPKSSEGKPLPIDPLVVYGKLDNGLTYYIRKNELPKDRAQFWLTVKAGAIDENDDQNGLAHFCEHMAFNGTKNFEKKEIINYLQRVGMKFGPEINAYTSYDLTNYMLQKVPIDVKENIDTSLQIIFDWAYNLSFDNEEIDNERGVIHEEWRTRRGASFRMRTETDKILYKGSKYAERDVIGDINIIDNFKYPVIKDFYKTWYRPDLQGVIIVGDFDVKEMEQKVIKLFSTAPKFESPKPRIDFEIPDHDETYVAIEKDKEARFSNVSIYYKHDNVKTKDAKYFVDQIQQQLYSIMINARLAEITEKAEAPFVNAYSYYGNIRRTKDAYISMAISKNNKIQESLKTILLENEKVKRFGFTETELERAKKDYLTRIESAYKEKDKRKSAQFCREYQSHFLTGEPIPGIEFEVEFSKAVIPMITLEDVNNLAKKWITDKNRVVIITGPDKEDTDLSSKEEILSIVNSISKKEGIEAYKDKVSNKPLFAEKVLPGKVVKETKDAQLGTIEWTLSNGIKIFIKQTDFKADEILMSAYSLGGSSLYGNTDAVSADFASSVVSNGGISDFDNIELRKMLSDKKVRVSPFISELEEGFNGSASPDDFETMLQLVHLYFTKPRIDETAFNSLMTRYKSYMANKSNDPGSLFRDSVQWITADYNFRARPMSVELLDEADFNKIGDIYKKRFADPASFTFFFVGNVDIEKAKPLLEKYLGSLSKTNNKEKWKDLGVDYPKQKVNKTIEFPMEVAKSTVYICYHNDFVYNKRNRLVLDAIQAVLTTTYTETIREEEGGTYGVGVRLSTSHYPKEEFQMTMSFDCGPENADKLAAMVYEGVENLKKDGPSEKHLAEYKKNKIKTHTERIKENRYWLGVLQNNHFHNENLYLGIDEYEKEINSLTPKEIQEAANKFLSDKDAIQLIMKPTK
ncbi:MAG: insulinase family protein [Saprospiraceae bacterium]|nr:insulinase family protein [Saprospiraceae bacterium]